MTQVPSAQDSASASKTTIPEKIFGSGVHDSKYQPQVFKSIGQIFQAEQYTDIMLMAEGQSIPCHRVALAAASEYFHTSITDSMEGTDGNHNLLEIGDVKFQTLQLIVSYLYTGFINLTIDNANDVIAASKVLKLESLYRTCEEHLKNVADVKNCITLYRIGTLYGMGGLRNKARKLMLEKFTDVVAGEEFMAMTEQELIEYIQSDELCLPNENEVFAAVVAWVGHDPDKRKPCMDALIEHVRLPYCTELYLKHVVSNEPLMKTSVCSQLLVRSLLVPDSPSAGNNQLHATDCYHCGTMPRSQFTKMNLLCIGGISKENVSVSSCWHLSDANKIKLEDMPQALFCFSACIINGGIMVTGGRNFDRVVQKKTWLWSSGKGSWSSMPDMDAARCRHASVCVGGQPYVLGGEGCEGKSVASVEYLDQVKQKWQSVPDMPIELRHQICVSRGQYIYAFGGLGANDQPSVCSLEFNSMKSEWKKLNDMPEVCKFGSGVVYKDSILIVGRFERCCLLFNPSQNQWTTLSQCTHEHADAPALLWRGKILVCGGRSEMAEDLAADGKAGRTSVIEAYDPSTDTWCISQQELPEKLSSHFVFCMEVGKEP